MAVHPFMAWWLFFRSNIFLAYSGYWTRSSRFRTLLYSLSLRDHRDGDRCCSRIIVTMKPAYLNNPAGTLPGRRPQQTQDVESMLVYRWSTVVDGEPTVKQHWFNVLSARTVLILGNISSFSAFFSASAPSVIPRRLPANNNARHTHDQRLPPTPILNRTNTGLPAESRVWILIRGKNPRPDSWLPKPGFRFSRNLQLLNGERTTHELTLSKRWYIF